ncbi:FHA domain-containing protein [Bdellovibrio bacteriovorus]|uniref:FHA domain-containing protein n=1 Tax=Bdellovibrio bacteriovorus TaxID=959 RepID=A0A1Z3N4S9_BDEBC|nr:FHA domain-containing protein [Bdellovibrio bacteriovorus]ASD62411.1 hypothetical protein B9G79_01945 [Bdellovibrio bacteriovorus]
MNIANKLVSISIAEDAIPFMFFVARLSPDRGHAKDFDAIMRHYGRRCIFLTVPNIQISSYKNEDMPGHASLTFSEAGYVLVQDYNSSNGTYVGLGAEDIERYLKKFDGSKDAETITVDFGSSSLVPRPPHGQVKIGNYLGLELARSFSILVLMK